MDAVKYFQKESFININSLRKDINVRIMEAENERKEAIEHNCFQTAYEKNIEIKTYKNIITMINELIDSGRYARIVSESFEMRMHITNEMLEKMPSEKINDYIKNEIVNSYVFKEHIKGDIEICELTNWPKDFSKAFRAEYKTYRSTKGEWPCL